MSEPVSFLNGKVVSGAVTIRDAGLQGMITLRGDLSNAKLKSVCKRLTGQGVPSIRKAAVDGDKGLCWMSPDELLVLVRYSEAEAAVATLSKALADQHHLAVNVSDARAYISVEGEGASDVMAKNAPVDLHTDSFKPGDFRRTRIGQVAGAFWRDDAGSYHVISFRSVGDYVFDLLVKSVGSGNVI